MEVKDKITQKKEVIISVYDILKSEYALTSEDGKKVFKLITNHLKNKEKVNLSFKKIKMTNVAFFRNAIGKLYRNYSEKFLKDYLIITDLSEGAKFLLNNALELSKFYYRDKNKYKKLINLYKKEMAE
jgi:hypothetical protein